jgi:leucyl aminopeptidase
MEGWDSIMKAIIDVKITTRNIDLFKCKADILAVGLFSDTKKLDEFNTRLDEQLGGEIQKLLNLGDFKAKERTSAVIYGNEKVAAKRILLIGLGEKDKATLDTIRNAAANVAKKAVELKAGTLALAMHIAFDSRFDLSSVGRAYGEGTYFGSYRYDEYITESKNGRLSTLKVEIVDSDAGNIKHLSKGLHVGSIIGRVQSFARTLANRPGNVIYPAQLATEAKKVARSSKGVTCTVYNQKQLSAKGMGGIDAVGSGSQHEPKFIILKYTPGNSKLKTKNSKLTAIALVGKAITFDSGGISIKPSANMEEMKFDKSGGIAVLAAIKAASELELPITVYGLIPSAENLPGGSSYRPGDIVTTYSGKTVEVQNTDAEGRMILCDALAYAVELKCGIIVDIATLTGACVVALGKYKAGLMGNDDDLIKQLLKASEDSGEKLWHMPCDDEYADEMKSKIADLKNVGSKWGGACTAAAFLRQFVDDAKWAHLDIAGMDMFSSATDCAAEGSSGFGVRLLTMLLINMTANVK